MGEISSITSKDFYVLKIKNNNYKYDYLIIHPKKLISKNSTCKTKSETLLTNLACGDFKSKKSVPVFCINGILAHYMVQELRISSNYRTNFLSVLKQFKNNNNKVIFQLVTADKQIIDYSWNERTTNLAWERVELDHALSWLSTLGGAFSALGDYFSNCALIAGKISFHQLQLALRLGDPTVASRCKLYFSLSLIQRGYLNKARNIIYYEYHTAKNSNVVDIRLIKMCLGIWAKLKYEYELRKLRL